MYRLTSIRHMRLLPKANTRSITTMTQRAITVRPLDEDLNPDPKTAKAHHVGSPPSGHFKNPWPSSKAITLSSAFQTKFGNNPERDNVPIPQGANGARSEELVKVRKPDWAQDKPDRLRATWIGHASFLVETPAMNGASRGVCILFDPVFSERTSPVGFLGPKRYTPVPVASRTCQKLIWCVYRTITTITWTFTP